MGTKIAVLEYSKVVKFIYLNLIIIIIQCLETHPLLELTL